MTVNRASTRLPPYGKDMLKVAALRNLWIFAGFKRAMACAAARRTAHGHGSALVLPIDKRPAHYMWPVRGCDVFVIWPGANDIEATRFKKLLLHYGALSAVTATAVSRELADDLWALDKSIEADEYRDYKPWEPDL